ncbi:MAG: transglycosylase domain-containing protein, partial [Thermomicrobiaceae bacterium]|nr:transglycosylase domain-containing protein [Thermomicrobiaceae bacterium]
MSRGALYRASLSRPRGRRRLARFGGDALTPRPARFPPPLLRGLHREPRSLLAPLLLAATALGALLLGLFVSVSAVGAAGGYLAWRHLAATLPPVGKVEVVPFATTKIYDRNGKLLSEVSDPQTGWRTPVGYQEILDHIKRQQDDPDKLHRAWIFDATVAAEDATFWVNPGFDPVAIARSFVRNVNGGQVSGASTITQQVVRILYPRSIGYERTYTRKLREALMAWRLTRHYRKSQILELYLNNVYYGNRAYGIDAAAQAY